MKAELSFRRGDLLAVGLILILALGSGLFFLRKAAETGPVTVEICRDGVVLETMPLNQNDTYTVAGDYTNLIVIEDGKVWMESSDCPGGDCLHSGKISASGRSIVCLPNRVEVRLVGGTPDEVDMVVGRMKKTWKNALPLCAVLTALALAISYMERFIPLQLVIPLPGVKLGLANLVTMTALYFLGTGYAVPILICRCILGSVFGGGITALAFSLTGGLLAMGTMAQAKKLPWLSVYGVSLLGAAAHNVGQILAAVLLLKSWFVLAYLPFLLLVAIATGFLTGAAASGLFRALLASGRLPTIP